MEKEIAQLLIDNKDIAVEEISDKTGLSLSQLAELGLTEHTWKVVKQQFNGSYETIINLNKNGTLTKEIADEQIKEVAEEYVSSLKNLYNEPKGILNRFTIKYVQKALNDNYKVYKSFSVGKYLPDIGLFKNDFNEEEIQGIIEVVYHDSEKEIEDLQDMIKTFVNLLIVNESRFKYERTGKERLLLICCAENYEKVIDVLSKLDEKSKKVIRVEKIDDNELGEKVWYNSWVCIRDFLSKLKINIDNDIAPFEVDDWNLK